VATIWTVTARYLETLHRSHDVLSKVDVLVDGKYELTIEGRTVFDSAGHETGSIGGKVDVARQVIRRRCSLTLVDLSATASLTPRTAEDLFVPFVTELRPWRGVRYWDATPAETYAGTDVEYVPLGTFPLAAMSFDWPTATLTGYDRMWDVVRRRLTAAYSIPDGKPVSDLIREAISSRLPAGRLSMNIPDSDATTPGLVWGELDDLGAKLTDAALATGQQLYVDVMGTFQLAPEPVADPDSVVYTLATGVLSNMRRAVRAIDANDTVNAIIAKGDPADSGTTGARGYAQDDNPDSLTYTGRIGVIPDAISSPLWKTTESANRAAGAELQRRVGLADSVTVAAMPNAALESGDVLRVEDDVQGIAAEFVADAFPVGMRAADGLQAVTMRSRVLRLTAA
jgi:hypothetical protein